MKKFFSLVLALMLVMSLSIAVTASAEETVTLTFSSWGDANEKALLQSILDTFTEETGIEVEYLYIPDDYTTKLTTLAASGELPDVGYLEEPTVVQWANNGMLEDMSSILTDDENTAKLDTNKFIDKDGNVVGISVANEIISIWYNPDYFDAMGIDYPPSTADTAWTWDEFVEVCIQLTVDANGNHPDDEDFDENNITTYAVAFDDAQYVYESLMRSNGGGVYSEDGTSITIGSEESLEVLQAIADLINVYHVAPSPADSVSSMDISACFLSNSTAMYITGQWALQTLAVSKEEDGINYDVGVLPYFDTPVSVNTGTPIVVFSGTEHLEEAMQLASYLLTADYVLEAINSGLWMPTTESWYTDEELIDTWMDDEVHPDHYEEAIIEYWLTSGESNSYFTIGCDQQIQDLWLAALDNVMLGTETAEEAIGAVLEEMEETLAEYLESIA